MQEKEAAPMGRRRMLKVAGILLSILVVLAIMLYLMIIALGNRAPADQAKLDQMLHYTYFSKTAVNGMKLHVLQTKPAYITLEAIHNNVTLTGKVGINGGFFYGDQLLSIGIVNSIPVNGGAREFGAGNENVKYARGTLVWDGASDTLSVQVVNQASELKVKDHTRFWAQGGISMSLDDDEKWMEQTMSENAPFPDDDRLRSAAVYDDKGVLYLIVSETKGSIAMFREAIVTSIGDGGLVDGIFLDGDGSSQMLSKEAALPGDNRPVVQMLRIVK
ncbi:phosphodiester glycosidase family protein [Paenibacillus alkaliterrae]|uniref:phosphodiester glycosidase family protein n=1 Tax=Paenibacillus alkaliterrae TaxID=320909 RepID=UPI0038B2ED94